MSRDPHDALIDQLLREILGGDRPRDITARVLAQAKIHDRFRRRWWVGASSAIAACIAIATGLAFYWPREYPSPHVTGGTVYLSAGGSSDGQLQRGQTVQTDDDNEGSFNIGNYVDVKMAPQTVVTFGGTKYQEKLFLDHGSVDVQVAKNKGKFDIQVGQALVHVTGTKFGLDVQDGLDETQSKRVKTLFVNVEEGSVDVQGGNNSLKTLKAGSKEAFIISSDPVPVMKSGASTPPQAANSIAPGAPRGRAGISAGLMEGARFGSRGAPNRPQAEANIARPGIIGTQNQIQNSAAAAVVRSMLIVVTPGKLEQTGSLRMVRGLYYLESEHGNYLLFPVGTPTLRDFKPVTDRPIHVTWENGAVTQIDGNTASKPI